MIHELKILPEYFKAVQTGEKTFEIRKNDRGFKVGDKIVLQEGEYGFPTANGVFEGFEYTGQEIEKEISYVLTGGQYGLEEGYCILGLKDIEEHRLYKYLEVLPQGIILKNIDLTGISELEQQDKIKEEELEFNEAFLVYLDNRSEENKKHVIEEFWDRAQTPLGLLNMYGITADEVMKYYPEHEKKILNRPRKKE